MEGEQSIISLKNVILSVVLILVGLIFLNPIMEILGHDGNPFIEFTFSKSLEVERLCKDFEGDLFLKLAFFESIEQNHYEKFLASGLPLTGNEDMYFRKVKLLCGAIIPIFESFDYGKNTQKVIYQINQTYGAYYNFELDGDEILGIVSDTDTVRDSWSHQIMILIIEEVEGID